MSSLFLVSADMAAATPGGAETTRHKLAGSPGAASTLRNKNTAAGPTVPLKVTDSVVAGTDGSPTAWYSEQLQAVTIAGQVVASLWGRESANTANAAPCIGVYRCDKDGVELATIVDPAGPSQGAAELATTAGGAAKTCTVTAANVVDTALADGERLKVALFVDDASGQGGTGSMGSGATTQLWVNGPTGGAGQAQVAFSETLLTLASAGGARQPYVPRRAVTRASVW
jgi:hypothetical protein